MATPCCVIPSTTRAFPLLRKREMLTTCVACCRLHFLIRSFRWVWISLVLCFFPGLVWIQCFDGFLASRKGGWCTIFATMMFLCTDILPWWIFRFGLKLWRFLMSRCKGKSWGVAGFLFFSSIIKLPKNNLINLRINLRIHEMYDVKFDQNPYTIGSNSLNPSLLPVNIVFFGFFLSGFLSRF